jgi:hypothetical protein
MGYMHRTYLYWIEVFQMILNVKNLGRQEELKRIIEETGKTTGFFMA